MTNETKVLSEALEIALDAATHSLNDARDKYGNYPLDGLGRKVVSAQKDFDTVQAALAILRKLGESQPVAAILARNDGKLRQLLWREGINGAVDKADAQFPQGAPHKLLPLYTHLTPCEGDARDAAFRELLEHAYGMTFGTDWNQGTAAHFHRDKLIAAVKKCRSLDAAMSKEQGNAR